MPQKTKTQSEELGENLFRQIEKFRAKLGELLPGLRRLEIDIEYETRDGNGHGTRRIKVESR